MYCASTTVLSYGVVGTRRFFTTLALRTLCNALLLLATWQPGALEAPAVQLRPMSLAKVSRLKPNTTGLQLLMKVPGKTWVAGGQGGLCCNCEGEQFEPGLKIKGQSGKASKDLTVGSCTPQWHNLRVVSHLRGSAAIMPRWHVPAHHGPGHVAGFPHSLA